MVDKGGDQDVPQIDAAKKTVEKASPNLEVMLVLRILERSPNIFRIFRKELPCSSQTCVDQPQSFRQAQDAEEGKKLLEADTEALIEAAKKGDKTKVGHVSPRLSTVHSHDRMPTRLSRLARHLSPRFEITALNTESARLGRCGS